MHFYILVRKMWIFKFPVSLRYIWNKSIDVLLFRLREDENKRVFKLCMKLKKYMLDIFYWPVPGQFIINLKQYECLYVFLWGWVGSGWRFLCGAPAWSPSVQREVPVWCSLYGEPPPPSPPPISYGHMPLKIWVFQEAEANLTDLTEIWSNFKEL